MKTLREPGAEHAQVVAPPWAARIDEILAFQGRSWAWLAMRTGIDATILSKVKNGKSHGRVDDLTEQQRDLVSQILEVPMGWIFQE